jgi:hypothetical protein
MEYLPAQATTSTLWSRGCGGEHKSLTVLSIDGECSSNTF